MKGSKKEFMRYLESELYDISLEAPEIFIQELQEENDVQQDKGSVRSKRRPLTNDLIKEMTSLLGPEAEQCFRSLSEIKCLQDEQILSCFKDLYSKYETVPVLFLSVRNDKKAVYVWQINRKCPVKGENSRYMAIDCECLGKQPTQNHISLLQLAKITSEKNEKLISANFIDDRKLMVRSQGDSQSIVIRIYYIKNFLKTARVNPFKEEVLANDLYSYRILLKEQSKNCLEVSLFRRNTSGEKTMEKNETLNQKALEEQKSGENNTKISEIEILLETQTCKVRDKPYEFNPALFEKSPASKDGLLLIEHNFSVMIAWENDKIYALYYCPDKKTKCLFKKEDCCFVRDYSSLIYYVNMKNFPLVDLDPLYTSTRPSDLKNHVRMEYDLLKYTNQILFTSGRSATLFYLQNKWIDTFEVGYPSVAKTHGTLNKFEGGAGLKTSFGVSLNHDIVLQAHNEQLIIYKMTEQGYTSSFLFMLPVQKLTSPHRYYMWNIIGSRKKFFLCGIAPNVYNDTTIIELKLDVDNIQRSELNLLLKTPLGFSGYNLLYGQVEGNKEDIVFIRFENEPFYLDKANLVYNEQISLIKPNNSDESQDNNSNVLGKEEESNEDKEQILIKKMNKLKNNIIRSKETQASLEETKDALKEIRASIRSKLAEIKQVNQQEVQKKPSRNARSEERNSKEPKGISPDLLTLYDDIKSEKKRIKRQNEKEKGKTKKERHQNLYL